MPEEPTAGEKATAFGAELGDLLFSGAGLLPLTAGIVANVSTRFQRGLQGVTRLGPGKDMTRREIGEEASAAGGRLAELTGAPVSYALKQMGLIPEGYQGPVGKTMASMLPDWRRLGRDVEHLTGGGIQDNEVEMFGQAVAAAAMGKGAQALHRIGMDAKRANEIARVIAESNKKTAARMTAEMQAPDAPQAPAGFQSPQPIDLVKAGTQRDAAARLAAEERAYSLLRQGADTKTVEAAIKKNPLVGEALNAQDLRRRAARDAFTQEPVDINLSRGDAEAPMGGG